MKATHTPVMCEGEMKKIVEGELCLKYEKGELDDLDKEEFDLE